MLLAIDFVALPYAGRVHVDGNVKILSQIDFAVLGPVLF